MKKKFSIVSINISADKGQKKTPVKSAVLMENYGIIYDAHAGSKDRQISFLSSEDIEDFIKKNKELKIAFGDFAENITTKGINFSEISIGIELFLGDAVIEITAKGKECLHPCEIFKQVGSCIMPEKGIFGKVLKGGLISSESDCYYNI
jgi:MOSC domain-containing protein YiiM